MRHVFNKFIGNDYSFSRHGKAVNTHWIDRMVVKPKELRNNSIETYKKAKAEHQDGVNMNRHDQSSAIQKDSLSHYGAEIAALAEQEITKALNSVGFKCQTVKK